LGLPQISKWLLTFGICRDQLLSAPAFGNLNGRSPLSEAAYCGWLDVVEVLLGAGADTDESMRDAMYFSASGYVTREVLRALINAGGDPNATGPDEKTALWRAVYLGYAEIVEMLINAGANVNVVCRARASDHESDVEDDGGNGVLWRYESALSLARTREVHDGSRIVKLLEDAGATYVNYLARDAN
jgi:ankyrin repeat protein